MAMKPKELGTAVFWLAMLGLVVLAGGQMIEKVKTATQRAL